MRIRRLDIENFRGIRELSWVLPRQDFFALVGPGDATKSTVLTAIERGLSDRWNISFQDTDFYDADIDSPISIRLAVSDLTDELLSMDAFGRHLCGFNTAGNIVHDPDDRSEPCVVVELRVESDLEPQWLYWRPGDTSTEAIRASLRAKFGMYRVDERVDIHLRWSRTSALGRLTQARHGTKQILTDAHRTAKQAVAANVNEQLMTLAGEIQTQMQQLGSAEFNELRPGLDLSLTNAQGNLALYDGPVPLMNFGLGTRRLAGAATQQLAHEGSALLLVDEVEYGLEPHRLEHLLRRLREAEDFAQVLVTTHSPTALRHLDAADLVTVRSVSGTTVMKSLAQPSELQAIIRSSPEAFLSRRILLGEGKTEYGCLLAKLEEWDREPDRRVPSSALGVVAVEGGGGDTSISRALTLLGAGYEVVVLMDSDVEADVGRAQEIEHTGGVVVRWSDGLNTETAICAELDEDGLTAFIVAAVEASDDPETAEQSLHDQLIGRGAPNTAAQGDVATWISPTFTVEDARRVIGGTAHKARWFKNVARGQRLGRFISEQTQLASGSVSGVLAQLRDATYAPLARSVENSLDPNSHAPDDRSAPPETPSDGSAGENLQ
jgi:putative ATP-dependent endonuclease of OLD family